MLSLEKPAEIFDREAEWAELVSFVSDPAAMPLLGVVSGRRRQGKTLLLGSLVEAAGGIYIDGTEGVPTEHFHRFGEAVAAHVGASAPLHFTSWREAIDGILDLPAATPLPCVIDEFPYLVKTSPELPSVVQAALDARRRRGGQPMRLLLCGSALTFMGGLLSGSAPLRGRAGLELVVPTLDYRLAAQFWNINDPKLALLTHAIVGGTPAYRREYVRDDAPTSLADFDGWVQRAVLNPARPLFREARYLLAEETDLRGPALYHAVLTAIAEGNTTRGKIANYVGRAATEISHSLGVLEDIGLIAKQSDQLRAGRPRYDIIEPLVTFYHAIVRPAWRELERRRAEQVWERSHERFAKKIVGPHFEQICRTWASDFTDPETFGGVPTHVGAAVINDSEHRSQYEIDVVVLGEDDGGTGKILCLGEAKWGETMSVSHLDRLCRIRDLLTRRGYNTQGTKLACYSGADFTSDLRACAKREEVLLIDLERLYYGT